MGELGAHPKGEEVDEEDEGIGAMNSLRAVGGEPRSRISLMITDVSKLSDFSSAGARDLVLNLPGFTLSFLSMLTTSLTSC